MTRLKKWAAPFALLLVAAFVVAACSDDGDGGDNGGDGGDGAAATETMETREGSDITLGAFDFGESQILAEIYGQQLEAHGFVVDRSKLQPGSPRDILKPALEAGEVDFVPEYVGTLLTFLGGEPTADGADNRDKAAELFADAGVTVLPAAEEAQDVNAFVITRELSERLGITKVSDLADHAADLKLGGPPECPERQFCLVGLKDVYGVEFGEFVPLDFGPRVTALKEGGIDVALLFSTDAVIATNDWVVLEDDKGLQPAENIAPVIRTALIDEYGDDLVNSINAVTEKLTSESLAEMNAEFQVDQRSAADIAHDWLVENDFITE
ncbi:MAG: ABC transporter substrate-binding protein [Dehalococcoidia bacterium]|nr:ABC transporter substrate-binding protein [Dehalococcoidia bacterium]MCA9850124.1 ABC transporter substrate-binding protein [Dehalococcoidia bacterium]MCA9857214.1 ABC transporter substrate-binding protein [Dehalococcoidia bacterium]MCB9484433.1 ABC transporter substrate-binding protein [Dehalococcoidia bacterium]MCB9490801.1 ABC transporter substrate-binding protein [Dehalococcoidia bacterium]